MPTTINIQDVKQLLNARETAINNLFETVEQLEETRTYKILKGGAGQSPPLLTGKTKQSVGEAFALLSAAVLNIGAMADLVSAKRTDCDRYEAKMLKDPAVLEGIHESLKNELVEIDVLPKCSSGFSTLTPNGQRASVTPEDLERVLAVDIQAAKTTIKAIDTIWASQITLVNNYDLRIAGLLNKTQDGDLARAKQAVQQASKSINANPLEADSAFSTTVEPLLVAVETRLQTAQLERSQILRAINEAERKWRTLSPLSINCDSLWINVQQHIAAPTEMRRAVKAQIDVMRESLTEIGTDRNSATPKSLNTKLSAWNVEADAYLAIENAAQTSYQSLLQQRTSLVARLNAFTGQAKGANVYEHASLLPTAEEALRLLGPRVQTPLVEATRLLNLYEQRLCSLVR